MEEGKIILNVVFNLDNYKSKKNDFFMRCFQRFFQDNTSNIFKSETDWKYTIYEEDLNKMSFVYVSYFNNLYVVLKELEDSIISFIAVCPNLINNGTIEISLKEKNENVINSYIEIDKLGFLYNDNNKIFNK